MARHVFYLLTVTLLVVGAFGQDPQKRCPEPDKIAPCTCYRSCDECQSVITCSDIKNGDELHEVFQKTGDTAFPYVVFSNINVPFFTAGSLLDKRIVRLTIVNSSLASLFDDKPSESSLLEELTLHNVRLQRGIQWQLFSSLHSLRSLIFTDTDIRRIDDSFGQFIPKQMNKILFTRTRTTRISRNAFTPLRNLESFAVRNTSVKTFERDMFPKPLRVKLLDLSGNKIETLPDGFFVDMPSLSGIDLNKNQISILNETMFSSLPAHVQYISVLDNPIRCDCSIKWITERKRMPYVVGKCTAPENMVDRKIRQLKKDDFKPC